MRFTSVIQYSKIYNVTFQGTNPYDMMHRLALRSTSGEPSKYIIVQYKYPVSLSI